MIEEKQTEARQRLKTFVTSEERIVIERKAKEAGLSVSAYLRAAALRQKIEPASNQQAVLDLLKAMADLGRLGGLLKLWLSSKPGEAATTVEVRRALRDIETTQIKLLVLIDRI
jgi:hypothetical protein